MTHTQYARRKPPALAAALAYLVFSWCFVAYTLLIDPRIPFEGFTQSTIAAMLVYIGFILLPAVAALIITRSFRSAFRGLRFDTALLVTAVVFFAYVPVVVINMGWIGLLMIAGFELPASLNGEFMPSGFAEYALFFIILTVFPAICEEVLFRGTVQRSLSKRGVAFSIFAASLLFALAHMTLQQLLPTFILGGIIGYLMHRTRSAMPGILYHFLHNGFIALLTILAMVLMEHLPDAFFEQLPISLPVLSALSSPFAGGLDSLPLNGPEMGVAFIVYSMFLSFPAALFALGAIWLLSLLKYTLPKPEPKPPKERIGFLPAMIFCLGALAPAAAIAYRAYQELMP